MRRDIMAVLIMLTILVPTQAPAINAQEPSQAKESYPIRIILSQTSQVVKCGSILTGVIKVTNDVNPNYGIIDTLLVYHVKLLLMQEPYYTGSSFPGLGWSWDGNHTIQYPETDVFPWVSATPFPFTGQISLRAIVSGIDYDVNPPNAPRRIPFEFTTLPSSEVHVTLDCPMVTTTFTHKEATGSETITEVSTETTPVQTSETCFSYLLRGDWDDFWMCALGLNKCVIATAAYGSPMAPEVVYMREVRDGMIGSTPTGRILRDGFNLWYYSWSPIVAAWISTSETLRAIFRVLLVPVVASVHVAGYAFEWLGGGDLAAIAAFSAAAVLTIGAYVLLSAFPLSGVFWFLRRRISKVTERRVTQWIAEVFLFLVVSLILSALLALGVVMMIVSAGILLVALLGAGVLTALRIVGLFNRRPELLFTSAPSFHGSVYTDTGCTNHWSAIVYHLADAMKEPHGPVPPSS
jgi:hypothetical protein